jgi:hypothetical protein
VNRSRWLPTYLLQIGDQLLTDEGQTVFVEGVADTGRVEKVYNFRVADFHTYFVGSSDWGFSVWAHNTYDPSVAQTTNQVYSRSGSRVVAAEQGHHPFFRYLLKALGYSKDTEQATVTLQHSVHNNVIHAVWDTMYPLLKRTIGTDAVAENIRRAGLSGNDIYRMLGSFYRSILKDEPRALNEILASLRNTKRVLGF